MKYLVLVVFLALAGCKSPEECTAHCTNYFFWPMPTGGTKPMPGPDTAVFYEYPGCTGAAYAAEGSTPFAYQSVQTEAACENESGIGHGEII